MVSPRQREHTPVPQPARRRRCLPRQARAEPLDCAPRQRHALLPADAAARAETLARVGQDQALPASALARRGLPGATGQAERRELQRVMLHKRSSACGSASSSCEKYMLGGRADRCLFTVMKLKASLRLSFQSTRPKTASSGCRLARSPGWKEDERLKHPARSPKPALTSHV